MGQTIDSGLPMPCDFTTGAATRAQRAQCPEWKTRKRNQLIDLARRGKLTPQRADERAASFGIPPLSEEPPWPRFDPMARAFWTAGMATVWIVTRDVWETRRFDPEFCKQWPQWVYMGDGLFPSRNGFRLFTACWNLDYPAPNLTAWQLAAEFDDEEPERKRAAGAASAGLADALQRGRIGASAIDIADGTRKPVPAYLWQDLDVVQVRDAPETLRDGNGKTRWHEPTLARDDVLRLWPPLPAASPVVDASPRLVDVARKGQPIPGPSTGQRRQPVAHKVESVREAVAVLWPKGIPHGLAAKLRNRKIVAWLEGNGRGSVSETTIRKALRS